MKKLIYLFVVGIMFAFTACGGGEAAPAAEEVAVCSNTGEPCLEDHSCCAVKEAAACCCGDESCDGSCHRDEAAAEEAHDHSNAEEAEEHSHE